MDDVDFSRVFVRVPSTKDLIAFLGMTSLLYSMWINSLLGRLKRSSDSEFTGSVAEWPGKRVFISVSDFMLASMIMYLSTVLFQPLAA